MIDIIFTLDYEIFGNGVGQLRELVYEPADRLMTIFQKWQTRFVAFVEIAEIEMIDSMRADEAVGEVKSQVRKFRQQGIEIGLHLHPQWYGAKFEEARWHLDYEKYNICVLPRESVVSIIERSLFYLRTILGESDFTPLVYRAGNWLLQPTQIIAEVLSGHGIKMDSSVFKGGLQHQHKLDYRRALRNGYYWTFRDYVDVPDPNGSLIEVPVYTQMIPAWKMLTSKRLSIHRKGTSAAQGNRKIEFRRLLDHLRFWYPLKLDFCRMTIDELKQITEAIIHEDKKCPQAYKPIVAIGHTKDLIDVETVDLYLGYLKSKDVNISTFHEAYRRCRQELMALT